MKNLFQPHSLGDLRLTNRIVMAPMTRSRALNNIPNELMAEYYRQRASAGLIITEGTSPSPNGLGYARIPGMFTNDQTAGWKKVTDAVHTAGGRIFLQMMHTGRIGHPLNLPPGGVLLAPSAVKPDKTKMWVDGEGMIDIPAPKEMTVTDIQMTIQEHVRSAVRAMEAGFDGVELHGANGYLIKQFLNPHTNRRTDAYGGSVENRVRFLLELTESVTREIGKEKVGVRLSPFARMNDMPPYPEAQATYLLLARELDALGIVYLHITDGETKGHPDPLAQHIRKIFQRTLILSGGYTASGGEEVVKQGQADLVSFGRPFLANPDLVDRFRNRFPLNQPRFELFYTPGAEGYVDYPFFEDVKVV